MHELGVVEEILRIAAQACGGRKVQRIVVEVGALTAILPEAMRFCFNLATEETEFAGAKLEIQEVAGTARCHQCGGTVMLTRPFGRCACGCSELAWLTGEELKVKAVEVA